MSSLHLDCAFLLNGTAMVFWGLFLFFRYDIVIAKIEGKKTAATKTKADVMIWRICGLWVIFTGCTCLLVTPYFVWTTGSEETVAAAGRAMIRRPMAWTSVLTHTVEVAVKYEALGPSKVWQGAKGNVVLALALLAGLCLG